MQLNNVNNKERGYSSKNSKDVLVFDVDGTLVDTLPHIYRSYTKAAEKLKLKHISLEYFRDTYTQAEKFRRHMKILDIPEPLFDDFSFLVSTYFKDEIKINKPKIISGVIEMLSILKSENVDLKILSLDDYENTQYKLGDKILSFFSEVLSHDLDKYDVLRNLKDTCSAQIFYVGDCISDGEIAVATQIKFIGLTSKHSFSSERKMREFIRSNLNNSFEASTPLRVMTAYQVWRNSDGIF
jgi:phosphoglycolate phosphatase-like HAD superfamily hydrolase